MADLNAIVYAGVSTVITLIMFLTFLIRNLIQYKQEKIWNWARGIAIITIFIFFWMNFFRFYYRLFGYDLIPNMNHAETGIEIYEILDCFTIAFGLTFCFYINGWESLLYFPQFMMIGGVFLYIGTGSFIFFRIFMIGGGVFGLILLYEASFRTRDDLVLGLALYFTLVLVGFLSGSYIVQYLCLAEGLLYALGKLNIFEFFEKRANNKIDDAPAVNLAREPYVPAEEVEI